MSSMPLIRFTATPAARAAFTGVAFAAFAMAAASAFSATGAKAPKRCDWHGPLSGGEIPYAKCVDFAAMEGKTITLPRNVTRIAADGISFCVPPTPTTGSGNADIVFVYDNSGSMTADGMYVNAATKDTSFYFLDNNNCRNNVIQPLQIASIESKEGGTSSVYLMDGNTGCGNNIPGDPYNARGAVIRAGIDFLHATSPTSTAGAMAFNSVVKYEQKPLPMNGTGNPAIVKASIKLDTAGSTEYTPPLTLAKAWLNDPAIIKTTKQAIIFISDGASNHNDYDGLVDANMPPIFSIYLSNDDTPNMDRLRDLSTNTGGTFSRVNTNDPKAMETILKGIISTITKNTLPKSATITNKSLAPPQVSKSTGATANPDGSTGMKLDSIIALKEGANEIEIALVREDSTVHYNFTMSVTAGDASASAGNYTCWDMPTLAAIDKKTNLPAEIYRTDNNIYQLKLTRSPSELTNVTVAGTSANNDKENISLGNLNNNLGFPTQTGDFTYNPAKANPGLNNGVLEVDNHGDLTFTWSHPRDARETVTYVLPGRIVPILSGNPILTIREPVTTGVIFDPVKIESPVVILDVKDKCILNCKGTEIFHVDKGTPTWNLTVKSPFKFAVKVFDNLGQFVSESEGTLDAAAWTALAKTGDSATVHFKILPVSREGQELGTGAYLMMLNITALGDEVTKNSAGESIIVKNAKREYLKKFGYVRQD
jgi:hypothetical protein